MAVEYDISSDVAVIKETGSVSQCARVTQMYSGQITYDDEAGSKFATATINGKSQRVMLCIAVNGTVTYDDVPSLYSTVDGHRCLNIVTPTETGTPDDVPSLYETVVIDGQNVRAVRCIMINKTPVYDGVSSTCTFTGDDGKTHTAQLVNKITGGSVEVIIKGTSPLNLPDAIANSLSYVKAFGGTEQNGTPTPTVPVDIVTNNGVLKVRHQSGLPLGYTLLDYIKSNRNIPLGFYTNQNSEIEAKSYKDDAGAQYVYQANSGSAITNNTTAYATDGGGNWRFGNQTISMIFPLNTDIISIQNKDGVWFNNERQGTYTNVNDFTGDVEFRALGVPTPADNPVIRISYIKHRQNGVLLGHYVSCVAPDNSIGLYDLIGGVFYTNADATITAGTAVSDPVEIYTDGTVETINVHGKNLFNQALFNTDVGNTITYTTFEIPNGTYTMSTNFPYVGGATNVFVFAGEVTSGASTPNNGVYNGQDRTITVLDGKYTVAYRSRTTDASINTNNPKDYDFQLELGSTATPYEPYYDGGTATAEMLLKVGDYQDEQEILSGAITRNVGVKVLDGTENWVGSSSQNFFSLQKTYINPAPLTTTAPVFCTHLLNSSNFASEEGTVWLGVSYLNINYNNVGGGSSSQAMASFKAFLADQYAAGTPVIVVYPLATPTTESVAGQALQVTSGDNVLEITQASLTGLELEAQYSAAVSLTIQEVQDANLDNNVTVTIN